MSTGAATLHSPAVHPQPRADLLGTIAEDAVEFHRYRFVVYHFVAHELKIRYQRSVLGFAWTLLNPLLMMAVLATFFSHVIGRTMENYALYLFAGMLPWAFFAQTVDGSSTCLIQAEGLIRKLYLPKLVFPISRMLIGFSNLVLSMTALLLLFMFQVRPTWALLLLPLGLLLLAAFTLGLGMLAATINTFFRDCGHILGILLQAWYFATPILYQRDMLPPHLQQLVDWNPIYPILSVFQHAIYYHHPPPGYVLGQAAAFAIISLAIGYTAFKYNEKRFVFRI